MNTVLATRPDYSVARGDLRYFDQLMSARFELLECRFELMLLKFEMRLMIKMGVMMTAQFALAVPILALLR